MATTKDDKAAEAKLAATGKGSGSGPMTAGSYGTDSAGGAFNSNSSNTDASTIVNPDTGQQLSGNLMVPQKKNGKIAPISISDLLQQSYVSKNLGQIRSSLIANNLLNSSVKSPQTVRNTWLQILIGAATEQTDPFEYMANLKASGFSQDSAAGPAPQVSTRETAPTDAASTINQVFKSELGRDATTDEIKKLTIQLNKAEKANPTTTTYKVVNGKNVTDTTGGINQQQFILDEINKLPEAATKKTDKLNLAKQDILATVQANGLPVDQNQIDSWANQVQSGTDVNVIKNNIRSIGSLGMPDNVKKMISEGTDLGSIYAPYKALMAKTLELNPNDIQLNDPTLRMAIGPDKEMTTYDFNNALRKDSRWQYTDNAHQTVSDAAMKVLQDFGFKG